MNTNSRFSSLCALLAFAGLAQASPILYEGFDYAAGQNLAGLAGGTWQGSGAWTTSELDLDERDTILNGGLTFGGLATTGNSLTVTGENGSSDNRAFATINGSTGTTVWVSYLLTLPAGGAFTGVDTAYLYLSPSSTGTSPMFGVFNDGSNNMVFGIGSTASSTNPNVLSAFSLSGGQTYLVVASITWNAGNALGGSAVGETINLYVNPSPGGAAPTPLATRGDLNVATLGGTNRLNALGIQTGGDKEWGFDEIRVGTTFADVAPVPEPSIAVLVLAAGVALAFKSSRRRLRA